MGSILSWYVNSKGGYFQNGLPPLLSLMCLTPFNIPLQVNTPVEGDFSAPLGLCFYVIMLLNCDHIPHNSQIHVKLNLGASNIYNNNKVIQKSEIIFEFSAGSSIEMNTHKHGIFSLF